MRTCQSCGKENPNDRDFCSCGEYLRWEPTGFVQAVTPEMAAEAAAQAAPPPPPDPTPAPPPPTPSRRASPARRPAAAARAGRRQRPPGRRRHAPTPPAPVPPTANSLPVIQRVQPPAQPAQPPIAQTLVRGAVPPASQAGRRAAERAGDDRPAPARRRPGQGPDAAPRRRARAARDGAGAGAQPERHRRQLRPARGRHAAGLVVDLPRHGLPRPLRLRRHVRAGGRDPPAPAARPRGRGARVGPARGRRLQGAEHRRRAGAAGAAHPAVHRDVHDPAPAAPQGPPQGDLRHHGDQQGQRAGAGRARRRGSGRRAAIRLQPPAAGDPRGHGGRLADAGPPAQADLDRPRLRAPAGGQDDHRRGGRTSASRPSRSAPTSCSSRARAPKKKWYRRRPPQVPGHVPAARLQAAAVPAGRHDGPGRAQRAHAADARTAGAGPADGLPQRAGRPGDAQPPRRAVQRALRPAAADPGHVRAEAVAAVVADPGDPAARAAAVPALPQHAPGDAGPQGDRRGLGVQGRGEADQGRAQAGPEPEGRGQRQGARGLRDQPDPEGGHQGREGRAGLDPDRRRLRQDRRAQHRRPQARRGREGPAREGPHARSGLPAARRSRGQDLLADPGRRRDRQVGRAGRHLLPRPVQQGEQGRRQGRREG